MNECSETGCKEGNLDDQDGIFYLEYEFGVPRVRIASSCAEFSIHLLSDISRVLFAHLGVSLP